MDTFYINFLYFFIYSVLGWIVETLYCRSKYGKWTNRGFLFGPYCPIYGFGALIVIYSLGFFISSPIQVFILAMIATAILEYLTSFILEKIFNAKWWDYSNMKFNINGRICLLNTLEFGILSLIIIYGIHPLISTFILRLPQELIQLISTSLLIIISIDTCSTVISLLNLKEKLSILYDLAEKLKKQNHLQYKLSDFYLYKELSEFRKNLITKRNIQIERILDAFPNFEFKEFKKQLNEFKLDLHKFKEELNKQKKSKKIKKLKEKN